MLTFYIHRQGLKKSLHRNTTQLMQKTGAMEKTVDNRFEEEERRIKNLQAKTEKLNKEAKGYLNSLRSMISAQTRIAETVDHFYQGSSDNNYTGSRYKQVADQLDVDCKELLVEPYKTTVSEPINRFSGYFPEINDAIKKRNKKLLDYDSQRAKVRKLVEKPSSDDPDKLPRAEQQLNEAREIYESLNNQLVTEMPELVDLRVPYLDPSFEALVKIQLRFCQESYDAFGSLNSEFPSDREVDGKVEEVLQQMKDLTICGMG
ncbi:9339_t:CDS:2 [Paraglomus brasilianum]|uniref:9339_t:CDS:1 n=1 Tax=Paraglomus brasilianum TaxID=144538 RepID=A0A9N9F1C3_9GLOM|nr:9339_t:CDS:2 [Paraglomus brasilianum]